MTVVSGLSNSKTLTLEELAQVVADLRQAGKVVAHCHGVFDLMHVGHIRHFEQAKQLGDVLIVTVTPDRFVNKGPNRPVFPEAQRAWSIAALACVDYVAINRWPMAIDTAWACVRAPSLSNSRTLWLSTVFSATPRRRAMAFVVSPSASASRTSRSLGVSDACGE